MLFLLALSVGQIIRHSALDILPFFIEVAFSLKDCATYQGVKPPPHLGHAPFEVERSQFDSELGHKQLSEIGLHLVMARSAGEVAQ
jgi:hypothetical protein